MRRIHSIASDVRMLCRRQFILGFAVLTLFASVIPHRASSIDVRPVFVIDREDIAHAGITNVWHLLRARAGRNIYGINRATVLGAYTTVFLVDGQPLPNVNVAYTLESLPVSAIERIEIFPGSRVVSLGDVAIGGAVNIVLRRGFEGAEFRTGIVRPRRKGGDSDHASLLWGGSVGEGNLMIGVDRFSDQEILLADREFGRAEYNRDGPSLHSETVGVSAFGNTVFYTEDGEFKAAKLGACAGEGFVDLLEPLTADGYGCGFAYADIAWLKSSFDREAIFASFDYPLGDNSEIYLSARYARSDSFKLAAPSPDLFRFTEDEDAGIFGRITGRLEIFENLLGDDDPARYILVAHRFVGHGNRELTQQIGEHDITLGIRGEFDGGIDLDAFVRSYRYTVDEKRISLVAEDLVRSEVEEGTYDIIDPLSSGSRQAVEASSAIEIHTASTERQSAGIALSGHNLSIMDRRLRWRLGLETEHRDLQNRYDYRDNSFNQLEGSDVLGTEGLPGVGERRRLSTTSEVEIPVTPSWDVVLGGRLDSFSDTGNASTFEVATRVRVNDHLTFRASGSRGELPPAIIVMNAEDFSSDAYVRLPGRPGQILRYTVGGNPKLQPFDIKSFSFGFESELGPVELNVDRFRVDWSNRPELLSFGTVLRRHLLGLDLPAGVEVDLDRGLISGPWANVGNATKSGIDMRLHTAWRSGRVDYSFDTRWLHVSDSRSGTFGILRDDDEIPRNRLHATIRATRGDVTAGWSVNSISSFNSSETFIDERYPSWIGHDLSLSWRNAFGVDNLVLTGGILNVTDEGPPTIPSRPDYYSLSYDTRQGRTLFLATSMTW